MFWRAAKGYREEMSLGSALSDRGLFWLGNQRNSRFPSHILCIYIKKKRLKIPIYLYYAFTERLPCLNNLKEQASAKMY